MKRWLTLALIAIVGFAALFIIDNYYREQIRQSNFRLLTAALEITKKNLEKEIGRTILTVEDLRAFMLASPIFPDDEIFNQYGELVLSYSPEVRALQYVNTNHIIRYIYPLEGNETALNLDLMTRPAAPFVEKAIQTRSTTVNDPTITVQGSLSIVVRSPIFDEDQYLGLAQGVIDITDLLENTSNTLPPRFAILLKDANGHTFWGDNTLTNNTLSSTVHVGDSSWDLTIGWVPPEPQPEPYIFGLIWGLGGALLISILFITNATFQRIDWLSTAVEKKTTALAKSEMRYRTLIEAADDAILLTDLEGNLLFCNSAYYTSLGFREGESIALAGLSRIHPDDQAIYQKQINKLLETGTQSVEYRIRHKEGNWIHRYARLNLIRDEAEAPQSILMIIRDITATKQLEEERARLEKQFYQAQKMEAVGQLTAGIAHDFNNMLAAISLNAELMQTQLKPEDPAQTRAKNILQVTERSADFIRKLLIFSRKQAGVPKIVQLNAVVTEMSELLERIIGESIEVEFSLAPDLWLIKVDSGQIEQVVFNLVVNARDAMSQGGKLSLTTTNVVIDENNRFASHLEAEPGSYVLLTVYDTGIGMNQEVQDRLFEPFFTTKKAGKGSGLGLAMVYGFVKQNQGHIWVHSEDGRGTIFKVYLPRTTEVVKESPPSLPKKELVQGNETILVVEDEAAIRALVSEVLTKQGYQVLDAENSQQALQFAARHEGPIHLLLTDVIMPGESGKVLAEQLTSKHPKLKVIYMSGYSSEVTSHHGVLEPDIILLQKPFSLNNMVRKVQEILE